MKTNNAPQVPVTVVWESINIGNMKFHMEYGWFQEELTVVTIWTESDTLHPSNKIKEKICMDSYKVGDMEKFSPSLRDTLPGTFIKLVNKANILVSVCSWGTWEHIQATEWHVKEVESP